MKLERINTSQILTTFWLGEYMIFWLVNHSWDSFRRSQEYCGFVSDWERGKIKIGDKIVYFGQGIVFGLFEAIALPNSEFNGWTKSYRYQVKLKPIVIPKGSLIAKQLESKILLQKSDGGSPNLLELNETEFNLIKKSIEENKKELILE